MVLHAQVPHSTNIVFCDMQKMQIAGKEYSVAQIAGAAIMATLLTCAAIAERRSIKR